MNEIKIQQKAIFDALDLSQFVRPMAVTLTMKLKDSGRSNDPIQASANFRHFMHRLNGKVLGSAAKRYGKKLTVFPVLEANSEDRLHYHAIIDRPDTISALEFEKLVRQQWCRTNFGYHEIDVQPVTTDGWLSYLCKARQKQGQLFEAIDWNNCTSILG